MLRTAKVVGKFVEYHGEGAASLPLTDRATIANMAPEYGATMGFFPVDEETCNYLAATGRTAEHVETFRSYYQAQGLFGIPRGGEVDYSRVLELDLSGLAQRPGPKRPQDRIPLPDLKKTFPDLLAKPVSRTATARATGTRAAGLPSMAAPPPMSSREGKQETDRSSFQVRGARYQSLTETEMSTTGRPPIVPDDGTAAIEGRVDVGHGDVLIAAILPNT
jgi:aconitate hydratase